MGEEVEQRSHRVRGPSIARSEDGRPSCGERTRGPPLKTYQSSSMAASFFASALVAKARRTGSEVDSRMNLTCPSANTA